MKTAFVVVIFEVDLGVKEIKKSKNNFRKKRENQRNNDKIS